MDMTPTCTDWSNLAAASWRGCEEVCWLCKKNSFQKRYFMFKSKQLFHGETKTMTKNTFFTHVIPFTFSLPSTSLFFTNSTDRYPHVFFSQPCPLTACCCFFCSLSRASFSTRSFSSRSSVISSQHLQSSTDESIWKATKKRSTLPWFRV